MNVFILDHSMTKSAQMLDDAHLKAQINEACQILMANYNWSLYHFESGTQTSLDVPVIGHVNHPVTKFYRDKEKSYEIFSYLRFLLLEYKYRFRKQQQNWFWYLGYGESKMPYMKNVFSLSKTYVNGHMTDDIEAIRHYISTKPMQKKPTWTNRKKPDWWEV